MKPLSAIYFIKENKKRSLLLVFMFILTFAIYIAGLYISNVKSMFHITMGKDKNVAVINAQATDKSEKNFNKTVEMLKKEKGITVIPQGLKSRINTMSIMGFTNDYVQYSFRTKEDFETYCKFTGIKIKSRNKNKELGNGSVIMSSLQADNRGIKLGDSLKEQDDESLDQKYTLDAITDNDGYSTYYISDTDNPCYMVLYMDSKDFKTLTKKLETEYGVYVRDYNYYIDRIDGQMESFLYIYFFIIILLSVVIAVTVNAAFAGFYQHRQGEFALYKAVGVSGKKLRLKIITEVLLIDITGIIPGVCIIMLGIYLANNLCLIPNGFRFLYYDNIPMAGMITSNLVILIPVIISQGRRLIKADICNY